MKRATAVYLPLALLFTLTVSLTAPLALAQGDMKTVRGTVVDKDENPLASAIVHLKNTRSMAIRTYITDTNGTFRFSGLDPERGLRSARRARQFDLEQSHHLQLRFPQGNRRPAESR